MEWGEEYLLSGLYVGLYVSLCTFAHVNRLTLKYSVRIYKPFTVLCYVRIRSGEIGFCQFGLTSNKRSHIFIHIQGRYTSTGGYRTQHKCNVRKKYLSSDYPL